MLIPKITYIDSLSSASTTPNISILTFLDSSTSVDSTIALRTWSYSITSGSTIVVPSTTKSPMYSIGINNNAATEVAITLLVEDALGKTASTRILVIRDGSGNINIVGVDVDAMVLPSELVSFTPITATSLVSGTARYAIGANFPSYSVDYTSDAVYDETNTTGAPFNTVYPPNTEIKATISAADPSKSLALGQVFTEVKFLSTITTASNTTKDVLVSSTSDCSSVTAVAQSVNYVEKLLGRGGLDNSNMSHLEIGVSQNCCSANSTFDFAPRYNFSLGQSTYVDTGLVLIDPYGDGVNNGFETNYKVFNTTITINGINPSLIASVTHTNRGNTVQVPSTGNTFTLEVLLETTLPFGTPLFGAEVTQNNSIVITTTKGFVYTINYRLAEPFVTQMTLTLLSVVYPTFPVGITISSGTGPSVITISPSVFGQTEFSDGIFQISLNDSGISNSTVVGCVFIDCDIYCLVLEALANQCDPTISIIYNALKEIGNCNTTTCANLCDLYNYLVSLLQTCSCISLRSSFLSQVGGGGPVGHCGCN